MSPFACVALSVNSGKLVVVGYELLVVKYSYGLINVFEVVVLIAIVEVVTARKAAEVEVKGVV